MDQNLIILGCCFFLSNIIGAIAGFGSVMVGLAFASFWIPIDSIPPIVMPVDCLTYGFVFFKSRKFVDRSLLFKVILPISLLGLVFGVILSPYIPTAGLRTSFGAFVLYFGITEFLKEVFVKNKKLTAPSRLQTWLLLISGGMMQGIFGSGGVMIVTYISRRILDKRVFRATLAALWILLNLALISSYIGTHRFTETTLKTSLFLLPIVMSGVLIGDFIHKKVSQVVFRRLVFVILCVAGASLIFH